MDVSVQNALIALVAGLLTLVVGDFLRRWRTRNEQRADKATVEATEAASDARTMDAINAAFKTITDRQADDLRDVRERLGRVETMLMAERVRGDGLLKQVEALTAENEVLIEDLARERERADNATEHCLQLEGEVRQLKQIGVSTARVYGQDGLPLEEEPV